MANIIRIILLTVCVLAVSISMASSEEPFPPNVDEKGNILLPSDFRTTWTHLGTWIVPSPAPPGAASGKTGPGAGIHNVYSQQSSVNAYKKNGKWPDGATIVMEVRSIQWDEFPTGHVMIEGDSTQFFVMVKDVKGRFPRNPNWGNGWGWAIFKPVSPNVNASTNYTNDCLSCHELAKDTDMVFMQGYSMLR